MMAKPVILRAPWTPAKLTAGTYMAAPKGRAVFRILEAVCVRKAGRRDPTHYRLTCAAVPRADLPDGATVRAWHREDRQPARRALGARIRPVTADPGPPEPPEVRLARIRAKAPRMLGMALKAIRQARQHEEAAQISRAARVGRDDGYAEGRNYGPGIRMKPIKDRSGLVLREADTEITEGPDPDQPNRTVRRAYRSDPLLALQRAGTISLDECEAAEWLRGRLQTAQGSLSGGGQSEIHLPAHERIAITDMHLNAWGEARKAVTAISWRNRSAVLWVTVGGSLRAFDRHCRMTNGTSTKQLCEGLAELADHYKRVKDNARKPGKEKS